MSHWSDLSSADEKEVYRLVRLYLREARRCCEAKVYLAGCVMAGAAVEAMLFAMLSAFGDELPASALPDGKPKPILKWTLAEMLHAAHEVGWLPAGLDPTVVQWDHRRAMIGDHVLVLKDIRNLVHAARYIKDHSRKRITKKYAAHCLDVFEEARQHLEGIANDAIREAMAKADESEDDEERGGFYP